MAIQVSQKSISPGVEDPNESFGVESSASDPSTIPRRNLTGAFDDLYMENAITFTAETPQVKLADELMSPTGVMEGRHLDQGDIYDMPHFYLHPDLKRDLSQPLVNRVAVYIVIHDINKEARCMAANDESSFHRALSMDEEDDECGPLIMAVNGTISRTPARGGSIVDSCLIDEERWLLLAIKSRGDDECRTIASCPPTFSQAMGERDYEDTLSTMENSRTQLWKPSRSWWEAKSGKNPWIEPKSHNKRWRYLWPLIHYHKFLAKCIKKLKRNSVDVKVSVSPVAVFLREEVCAVSDHLASVSNFGSEEWMEYLATFTGWMDHDESSEARIRSLILSMALRPLTEHGDVDSPLLKSQIDEQFLRSMVAAREHMANNSAPRLARPPRKTVEKKLVVEPSATTSPAQSIRPGLPLHPKSRHTGFPPTHPKSSRHSLNVPRARQSLPSAPSTSTTCDPSSTAKSPQTARPSNYSYYWPGWTPQYAFCDDGTSVESALSGDSYPCQYASHEYSMYPHHGYYQYPSHFGHTPDPSLSHSENGSYPNMGSHDGSYYPMPPQYHADPNIVNGVWYPPMGDPSLAFGPPPMEAVPSPCTNSTAPPLPMPHGMCGQSPHPPNSPLWGHLDYNTLAISGIMTPQGTPHGKMSTSTPRRLPLGDETAEEEKKESTNHGSETASEHMFQGIQYYPPPAFYYGVPEGYPPPSPATQFMMPPQGSPQAAYYAYNLQSQYYMSPHRHSGRRRSPRKALTNDKGVKDEHLQIVEESLPEKVSHTIVGKPPDSSGGRISPGTVTTETESVSAEEGEQCMSRA